MARTIQGGETKRIGHHQPRDDDDAAEANAGQQVGIAFVQQRIDLDRAGRRDRRLNFAADQATDIDAIRDRHCACYADFLAAREAALRGEGQPAAMLEINMEIDNVRWMWQHAEGIMHCRHNLARIQLGLNNLAEARRHLQEAFQIGVPIGAVRDSLEICVTGADLLRREGQLDRAARVIGCVLNHDAATAAVQEDARGLLAKLETGQIAVAEARARNVPVAEIAAMIAR